MTRRCAYGSTEVFFHASGGRVSDVSDAEVRGEERGWGDAFYGSRISQVSCFLRSPLEK